MSEGYEKYSKKGAPFLMPDLTLRPVAILPQENIKWLVDQPETVLNGRDPILQRIATPYITPNLDIAQARYLNGALQRDLTRNLARSQPALDRQCKMTVDRLLGSDSGLEREACLWDLIRETVRPMTYHVLLGEDLANNGRFLGHLARLSVLLNGGMGLVGQVAPFFLKPLLGYLLAIPIYAQFQLVYLWMKAPLEMRLKKSREQTEGQPTGREPPEDLMTWMANRVVKEGDWQVQKPRNMTLVMVVSMSGFINSTSIAAQHVLLDLLASPPDHDYFGMLREEADSILRNEQDWHDPARLHQLVRMDSAIRESLRKNPPMHKMLVREASRPDGIVLPNGLKLPQKAWVGTSPLAIHHDERFYPRPHVYDPFRFLNSEADGSCGSSAEKGDSTAPKSRQSLTNVTTTFMSFGYGRHSCPGRHFVGVTLKLLLAYIILNYDIEPLDSRPLNYSLGDAIVPPTSVKIKVRRRSENTSIQTDREPSQSLNDSALGKFEV